MESFNQKIKTETIPVSGNCSMCKSTIEKSAKKAGASTATWNIDTKILTIKYNTSTTNAGKIQKAIAAAGYDTRDFKATDESYNKLHACCQYDRTGVAMKHEGCSGKCDMKDGKCADMATCIAKECCKDAETCKAKGCCN
jgi:periplasmic mercuric ion binding protein